MAPDIHVRVCANGAVAPPSSLLQDVVDVMGQDGRRPKRLRGHQRPSWHITADQGGRRRLSQVCQRLRGTKAEVTPVPTLPLRASSAATAPADGPSLLLQVPASNRELQEKFLLAAVQEPSGSAGGAKQSFLVLEEPDRAFYSGSSCCSHGPERSDMPADLLLLTEPRNLQNLQLEEPTSRGPGAFGSLVPLHLQSGC